MASEINQKEREFNLSEEITTDNYGNDVLRTKKVKEFIKRLKEKFKENCFRDIRFANSKNYKLDGLYNEVPYHYTSEDFLKILDKLAGDKLI